MTYLAVSSPREIDVERARADTPGCAHVNHLNNAGAALMPAPVLDALQAHLRLEAEMGGYEAAEVMADARERTYRAIGRLINCHRDEVGIIENATRAWDMAFYGLAQRFRPGDRILTSRAEYCSNYVAYLHVANRTGAVIEVIDDDAHGQVSLDAMARALAMPRAVLVGMTHVPTSGGLVNPAEELGRLTRSAGVPYLLDACQSAGQWPLDVEAIGCDMLSATGRKFLRGPRGTGFLYVRRKFLEQLEPPLLDVHSANWVARDRYELKPGAARFENWESYIAGAIGLGVAVEYALGIGIDAIQRRVVALANRLRAELASISGVRVRDLGRVRCGIVSFTVDGREPSEIRLALHRKRINVSVSNVRSTRLDMEARGIPSLARASVHYYNTEAEVDQLVAEIHGLSNA